MYIITLNKLISLPVCNHSLYLNIHCLQKEWERWGKKSSNATQGNIQIEQSVYSTNTYFLINIQNKDRFFSFTVSRMKKYLSLTDLEFHTLPFIIITFIF